MNNTEYNPYVDWIEKQGLKVLYFEYKGYYDKESVDITVERCRKLITGNSPEKTIIIFNCLYMDDYDHTERPTLFNLIKELKVHIDSIHTLINSPLIMAAAEIISFFSGFKIRHYTSQEKFEKGFKKYIEANLASK